MITRTSFPSFASSPSSFPAKAIPSFKAYERENSPLNGLTITSTTCASFAYRSRMVKEPRKVLSEFDLSIPENVAIRVHDSTADMRYLVLPMRPAGTEGWDEDRLAAIVTRNSMIGVDVPKVT